MNSFNNYSSKIILENFLPHNFLAEKLLLSCIFFNNETLEIIKKSLVVEAFYFKNHQELYKVILEMNNSNLPIDILTVTVFLQNNGLLSKIGGIKVLLDLGNQSPTFSYLSEYIRIVKEKFLKRYLLKLGYKIINSSYISNESLENILIEIEQDFLYLTNESNEKQVTSTAQALDEVFVELKSRFLNPKLSGLPSGFSELDKLTQGFQKSDLIIIAGRPSLGKTALSLNIALNAIKLSRLPVLFCSLEMSKSQLLYRLLSSETGINQVKLKNGKLNENDWIKLNKIIRILAKLPFFIDDTSTLSIQEIRSKIKTVITEQTKLGLVIIDYLQLIKSSDINTGNRVQELSQITRSLKSLAREFNVPIIALSQLSRNVDNRINQRPILSDLRESGSIEQDADLILMLSRNNLNNSQSLQNNKINKNELVITELIIAKQRNGPIGTVKLEFNESQTQFLQSKAQ